MCFEASSARRRAIRSPPHTDCSRQFQKLSLLFHVDPDNMMALGLLAAAAAALEPCRPGEHDMLEAGRWVVANASRYPPCCGWDGSDWRGEAACQTRGESTFQRNATQYAGPSSGWAQSGGLGCRCVPKGYYTWDAPTACRLLAWDARAFCDVLGRAEIKTTASLLRPVMVGFTEAFSSASRGGQENSSRPRRSRTVATWSR